MSAAQWNSPDQSPAEPGLYFRYYGNLQSDREKDYWDGQNWWVNDDGKSAISTWRLRWRADQ